MGLGMGEGHEGRCQASTRKAKEQKWACSECPGLALHICVGSLELAAIGASCMGP